MKNVVQFPIEKVKRQYCTVMIKNGFTVYWHFGNLFTFRQEGAVLEQNFQQFANVKNHKDAEECAARLYKMYYKPVTSKESGK